MNGQYKKKESELKNNSICACPVFSCSIKPAPCVRGKEVGIPINTGTYIPLTYT